MASSSRSSALLLRCLSRPGPSRLASRQSPCQVCLREASTSSSSSSTSSDSAHAASQTDGEAEVARPERRAPASVDGYDSWLRSVGIKYRDAPVNGPNWLGGEVVSCLPRCPIYFFLLTVCLHRSPTPQTHPFDLLHPSPTQSRNASTKSTFILPLVLRLLPSPRRHHRQ